MAFEQEYILDTVENAYRHEHPLHAGSASRGLREINWTGEAAPAVNEVYFHQYRDQEALSDPPVVEVLIEVPRGSFLKRGSTGEVDFVSPLPCPFNYGSVPDYLGLEGDLLDALVLGPRLPFGTRIRVKAWGAVTLTDRGMSDDKLVCSDHSPSPLERQKVLQFFHFYAKCKGMLNIWRCRPGRNACEGWCEAIQALARARRRDASWQGPPLGF
ncbi:inorganic pyrophosphatase [Nitrosospira sp. Nl5]|nr:inorganic pyrophosphatase [Nitrosospira sp. Nl5]